MNTLYTAGYNGGWTPAALLAEAERLGAAVFDIRMSPTSQRPEWRRDALAAAVDAGDAARIAVARQAYAAARAEAPVLREEVPDVA